MLNHDIEDYKTNAQKEMGPFKGMVSTNKSSIPAGGVTHIYTPGKGAIAVGTQ
jgi:hypothetical protein